MHILTTFKHEINDGLVSRMLSALQCCLARFVTGVDICSHIDEAL